MVAVVCLIRFINSSADSPVQTNLIYLALITERVAIIPPFVPFDDIGSGPDLEFGQVFDVTRLQKEMGKPVLEWYQVKVRLRYPA